jgi:flagellar biosynthesis anti-sigma factor FlgM
MRIDNESLKPGTEKLQKSGVDNVAKSKISAYSDVAVQSDGHANVTLSNRAQELSRFSKAAVDAPEIGADRVAALRHGIQNGTYRIDFHQLAADMMG